MSRWRPDARERLERAAFELFAEQGFAATTVPEITARAGLTTRTFFRYFADKREVIFGGAEIPDLATRLIADAPASLDPVTLVYGGLQTVAETRANGWPASGRMRACASATCANEPTWVRRSGPVSSAGGWPRSRPRCWPRSP